MFSIYISIISVGVKLTCHADVVDGQRVEWFRGLTSDFAGFLAIFFMAWKFSHSVSPASVPVLQWAVIVEANSSNDCGLPTIRELDSGLIAVISS